MRQPSGAGARPASAPDSRLQERKSRESICDSSRNVDGNKFDEADSDGDRSEDQESEDEITEEERERRRKIVEGLAAIADLDAQLNDATRRAARAALERANTKAQEALRLRELAVRELQMRKARLQAGMRGEDILAKRDSGTGKDASDAASIVSGHSAGSKRASIGGSTVQSLSRATKMAGRGRKSGSAAMQSKEARGEPPVDEVDTSQPLLRRGDVRKMPPRVPAGLSALTQAVSVAAAQAPADSRRQPVEAVPRSAPKWAMPRARDELAVADDDARTQLSGTVWPPSPPKDFVHRNIELAATYMPTRRLAPAEEARLKLLLGELDEEGALTESDGGSEGGKDDMTGDSSPPADDARAELAATDPYSARFSSAASPPNAPESRPTTAASAVSSLASQETSAMAAQKRRGRGRSTKRTAREGSHLAWQPDVFGTGFLPEGFDLERIRQVDSALADMVQRQAASEGAAVSLQRAQSWLAPSVVEGGLAPAAEAAPSSPGSLQSPRSPPDMLRPGTASSAVTDSRGPTTRNLKLLPFFITALDEMGTLVSTDPTHASPRAITLVAGSARGPASVATRASLTSRATARSVRPETQQPLLSTRSNAYTPALQRDAANDASDAGLGASVDGVDESRFGDAVIAEQRRERLLKQRMALIDAALSAVHGSIPGGDVGLPGRARDAASVVTHGTSWADDTASARMPGASSGVPGSSRPSSPNSLTSARSRSSMASAVTVTRRLTGADIDAEVRAARQQLQARAPQHNEPDASADAARDRSAAATEMLQDVLAPKEKIDALLRELRESGALDALPQLVERGTQGSLRWRAGRGRMAGSARARFAGLEAIPQEEEDGLGSDGESADA